VRLDVSLLAQSFIFGADMKYGCTPIGVTRIGDYVFDRELAELDDEAIEDDGDHSDEQFDRMDRQNELR
jgi:hypothetical protein